MFMAPRAGGPVLVLGGFRIGPQVSRRERPRLCYICHPTQPHSLCNGAMVSCVGMLDAGALLRVRGHFFPVMSQVGLWGNPYKAWGATHLRDTCLFPCPKVSPQNCKGSAEIFASSIARVNPSWSIKADQAWGRGLYLAWAATTKHTSQANLTTLPHIPRIFLWDDCFSCPQDWEELTPCKWDPFTHGQQKQAKQSYP